MKKFFYCIVLFFFSNHIYANKNSCHSIFLSVSRNKNITNVKCYGLKFLTNNEDFHTGFDIAYNYGLSEYLYLGIGIGYWSSSSSVFKLQEDELKVHDGFVFDGRYLKFPLSVRFYFHDYLNVIKTYLYGDIHLFSNVWTKTTNKDENIFNNLVLTGKKLSFGNAFGAGLNLSISPTINIFTECLFTLRPFFAPIEVKIDEKIGNFKISNFVINFGLHFDFAKTDKDKDLDDLD